MAFEAVDFLRLDELLSDEERLARDSVREFAADPAHPVNAAVVDLALAPRNAEGNVVFSADFYLLKPVDPTRGNGRLFYEVGNRGGKGMLVTFQAASGSTDPTR